MEALLVSLKSDMMRVGLACDGLLSWKLLRGKRLFLTGGTGFVGKWLLNTLCYLNEALGADIETVVLSRHPERFLEKYPHFAGRKKISWCSGDVRSFDYPRMQFDYVIHAATEANQAMMATQPLDMLDVIVNGTDRVLAFAAACAAERLLLVSSGSVYGTQPPSLQHVAEGYPGSPDSTDPMSCYAEGKRLAEQLCACYAQQHGLSWSSARCFAFVGPYLPLDKHFAIGNFILNCLRNEPIEIKGDGTPLRSYLYAGDLVTWLLTILVQGRSGQAYNVGSDRAISIRDMAHLVREVAQTDNEILIRRPALPGVLPSRYVPSVEKAKTELGVRVRTSLRDALEITIQWYRDQSPVR